MRTVAVRKVLLRFSAMTLTSWVFLAPMEIRTERTLVKSTGGISLTPLSSRYSNFNGPITQTMAAS